MEHFDDQLLDAFAHTFYGYGNYNGAYWFIGIEERGNSFDDVERRLAVWDGRGRLELDDVVLFHEAIGYGKLFEKLPHKPNTPLLQPTWNKLMRILLSASGRVSDKEDAGELKKLVRDYQQTKLGRTQEESCLIELFPLPSPSSNKWIYSNHSDLDYCANRKAYKEHFMALRISHIKSLIAQYKPKVVVFYSNQKEYVPCWQQIANATFSNDKSLDISIAQSEGSVFMIMKHPAHSGKTNAYYHNLGKALHLSEWG